MKKTIAILLVLCLCVGLCACTAKENTVKENEKEESIYHPQGYVGVWVSSATQYEEIFPQSFQLFSNGKAIIDNGRNAYTIDEEGFNAAFQKHQEKSRAGAEQQFKGGLADHSELTTALHTATHLLHAALRKTLGTHVGQKGSNITAERLRFDFTHPEPVTKEQLKIVEDLVNDAINRDLPVTVETLTLEEAREQGAVAFFDSKYGEKVTVYTIGDFSKEVCGGPHVEHTGSMGHFKIQKEQSSSAGVRRIKAVLEK